MSLVPDAVPAPIPQPAAPPALEYHRLALRWHSPRWWKPLLGLLVGLAVYLGFLLVLLVAAVAIATAPMIVTGLATGLPPAADQWVAPTPDLHRPADFAFLMATVIALLPATLIGFRVAGCAPIGLLSSVAGRLRWRWLLLCAGPATAVLAIALLGVNALQGALTGEWPQQVVPTAAPLLFILILVLVPIQAAAEEYAFRGALMQSLGRWLKHPAWAIVLPIPLFVFGHGYDLPGQLSVAVFAAAAGWITWRTGGLEAAIALHVVNNLFAMLLGAFGFADLNATELGWESALLSAAVPIAYVLWIDAIRRRRGAPARTTEYLAAPAHAIV